MKEYADTACAMCLHVIEHYNRTWWIKGTCRSVCDRGQWESAPHLPSDPVRIDGVPPLDDLDAVEAWLNS